MRETTALTQDFNHEDELIQEDNQSVIDTFTLPNRNWNLLVDSFNSANKKKFPFTALQCKVIVEFVKKGIPPRYIFQSIGVSTQRYTAITTKYTELEARMSELQSKEALSDDEYNEYQKIMRNPFRILMSDIDRAEGVANLEDWEKFNEMAARQPDLVAMKMRAKFKEFFSDKDNTGAGFNVQINLGGKWIDDL